MMAVGERIPHAHVFGRFYDHPCTRHLPACVSEPRLSPTSASSSSNDASWPFLFLLHFDGILDVFFFEIFIGGEGEKGSQHCRSIQSCSSHRREDL